jgi:hypothetical protein
MVAAPDDVPADLLARSFGQSSKVSAGRGGCCALDLMADFRADRAISVPERQASEEDN